jgi:hypothetical protein
MPLRVRTNFVGGKTATPQLANIWQDTDYTGTGSIAIDTNALGKPCLSLEDIIIGTADFSSVTLKITSPTTWAKHDGTLFLCLNNIKFTL